MRTRAIGAPGSAGAAPGGRLRARAARLGLCLLPAISLVALGGVDGASATGSNTWTCTSLTAACSWTVPSDVYGTATITVDGAQGGSFDGTEIGGDGAAISGTYTLVPGAAVVADVGTAGGGPSGSVGGLGGDITSSWFPAGLDGGEGGYSQYGGGSGGGAGTVLYIGGSPLVIAAGGGGAGGPGVDDPTPIQYGGTGGTPFVDNGDGVAGGGCNGGTLGGDGGSNGGGGAGSPGESGNGCFGISTTGGASGGDWGSSGGGTGGEAPNSDANGHAGGGGGGGGGGYGGGGGAGAAAGAASAGGGGAGGSYVSSSVSGVSESGTNAGNGSVTIVYLTGTAPAITSALSDSASAGTSLSVQLQASGQPAPTFSEAGALPAGISLSSSGLLSGSLGTGSAGSWPFLLTATNSVGSTTETYLLTVTEPSSYVGEQAVASGTGTAGTSPNGTPEATAELDGPSDVTVDAAGDLFVLDGASSTVEEIPAKSLSAYGVAMTAGEVYDIAGDGVSGDAGDSGPGYSAKLDHPGAIALDSAGDVFIADTGNDTVRVLAAKSGCLLGQPVTSGDIYTVIGTPGKAGYSGDGGAATSAELDGPQGVALDSAGDVFVADSGNDVVREVRATTSCSVVPDIETVVGTGVAGVATSGSAAGATELDGPGALAVGPDGNLYIDDAAAELVLADALSSGSILGQSVTRGDVYVVAGDGAAGTDGDGGPATSAELDDPGGIALDAAGDLYLSDPPAGDVRVVAASATSALFGVPAATGDIYEVALGMTDPLGIGVDPSGALYAAEGSAEELGLLGIAPSFTSASSTSMQAGSAGSFTFSASGEPAPQFTASEIPSGGLPAGLAVSASGVLSGTPALGSAGKVSLDVVASNGVGQAANQTFTLTITAATTTLGFALVPSTPVVAATAKLTVTVSPTPDSGTTLSVSDAKGWFDCPSAAVSAGTATCTSSTIASTASDQVTARFAGDTQYATSTASYTMTASPARTALSLTASPAAPS
ncbi:MAG TPA: putative Ig domain-containing protein, partial [Acidimicrobiales bacterium]|nr:putative Ig domain-containing protein [Acidimicrobiales bacterium]